jgi:hypothetical protein
MLPKDYNLNCSVENNIRRDPQGAWPQDELIGG